MSHEMNCKKNCEMNTENPILKKLKNELEDRRYAVSIFSTKEDAVKYISSLFDGDIIGFGDSETMVQMKLHEALSKNNTVIDPKDSQSNDEFLEIAKECLTTDYFFTSANAITENGVIINMDGTGNRVAGSLFGHKKIFFIIGKNKITSDIESGIQRVRNVAAPKNARRLCLNTPCAVKGDKCYDCKSSDRICNGLLIQLHAMSDVETEVILIDEYLGY